MIKISQLAILVVVCLFGIRICSGGDWRGITPLVSTRTDVEKILGIENENGFYDIVEGRVRIFYGGGQKSSTSCLGRADRSIVTRIDIDLSQEKSIPLDSLLSNGFIRAEDSHHGQTLTYTNWEKGLGFAVDGDSGLVFAEFYYPTASACRILMSELNCEGR